MEEGFPFIKRQFLHENPFHVPDLDRWKERVLAINPGADVEAMEENLWRVSPVCNLHRALDIHTLPNGAVLMPELVGPDNFEEHERWCAPVRPLVGLRRRSRPPIASRATPARCSRRSATTPRSRRS